MHLETNFQPSAAAELARQIETLEPSAALLNSKGFSWMTAAYLAASIKSGRLDLGELRDNGISQGSAVSICAAIAARHARVEAARIARAPLPVPAPVAAPKAEELDQFAAMSLLHDLTEQITSGRGDVTVLERAGFTPPTARELTNLINASRGAH
jgi:hypothetical protein